MSNVMHIPYLKKLFLGFLLCSIVLSLNSCDTLKRCIYASNNFLE